LKCTPFEGFSQGKSGSLGRCKIIVYNSLAEIEIETGQRKIRRIKTAIFLRFGVDSHPQIRTGAITYL
jgi:hypothetical protein